MWKPFRALKVFLPRTMFGRALLILLTPLVLVQITTTTVFYDRHWTWVTRHLGSRMAQQFVTVVEAYETDPQRGVELAKRFGIESRIHQEKPKIKLRRDKITRQYMTKHLRTSLNRSFRVGVRKGYIDVIVQRESDWLRLRTSRKYLSPLTTPVFLLWSFFTPLIFFIAAAIFMRNQVRPMRRLADAAYRFGRGDASINFKPEGAEEVKRAGVAFQVMQQRIQRQMTMRTEMLAGVSHDLRTPLTRMELAINMIKDEPKKKELLKDVKEMTALVNSYLAFAKDQDDGEPVEQTKVIELLADAVKGVPEKNLTTEINVMRNISLRIRPNLMLRGLRNIVENAIRYADNVWVHAYTSKDYVYITIEDDGPGIPAEARLDVFKPFFRLEGSRNPKTGGTGLGMSVAKEAIVRHGGRISLTDSRHGGLAVNIKLPR